MAKTDVRVFKTVFRVDFPTKFALLDRIGATADLIQGFVRRDPFKDVSMAVDVVGQSVTATGKMGEHSFRLHQTLASVDGTVEFTKPGLPLGASVPALLELAESVVSSIDVAKFARIGYRAWLLAEGPDLKFQAILNEMNTRAGFLNVALSQVGTSTDIAYTVEAALRFDGPEHLRLSTGPYRNVEHKKYFSRDPDVTEGLILDMDAWQNALEMPNPNLRRFGSQAEKTFSKIAASVVDSFRGNTHGTHGN